MCIFARKNSKFEKLDIPKSSCIEIDLELCGVINKELKTIVLVLYRSPMGNFDVLLNNLEEVLDKFDSLNYKIFLFGDFNVNVLEDSRNRSRLFDLCGQFNLEFKLWEPTRVTSESATCIDNLCTNLDSEMSIAVFEPHLGDHKAISLKCEPYKNVTGKMTRRLINHTNMN